MQTHTRERPPTFSALPAQWGIKRWLRGGLLFRLGFLSAAACRLVNGQSDFVGCLTVVPVALLVLIVGYSYSLA